MNAEIRITRAEEMDLREILDLQFLAYQSEAKLFGNPRIPPLTQTLEELRAEFLKGVVLKAVDGAGRIVGSVRAYNENGTAFIGKLMVTPDLQGRGIGSRLLAAIEAAFPGHRYELFTSSRSRGNLALYEKRGYRAFREREVTGELRFVYLEKGCIGGV